MWGGNNEYDGGTVHVPKLWDFTLPVIIYLGEKEINGNLLCSRYFYAFTFFLITIYGYLYF